MSTLLLVLTLFALQCRYIDNNCAGEVTLVRPEHNIGQHTAVLEPQDDVAACWPQQRLLAVLSHRPGHWLSYRKVAGHWYELDSATPNTIRRSNPFTRQLHSTIELLLFKE